MAVGAFLISRAPAAKTRRGQMSLIRLLKNTKLPLYLTNFAFDSRNDFPSASKDCRQRTVFSTFSFSLARPSSSRLSSSSISSSYVSGSNGRHSIDKKLGSLTKWSSFPKLVVIFGTSTSMRVSGICREWEKLNKDMFLRGWHGQLMTEFLGLIPTISKLYPWELLLKIFILFGQQLWADISRGIVSRQKSGRFEIKIGMPISIYSKMSGWIG